MKWQKNRRTLSLTKLNLISSQQYQSSSKPAGTKVNQHEQETTSRKIILQAGTKSYQEQKATSRNIEPTAGTMYYQQDELFCQQE
ncbi:hypothetical protein Tco_0510178, partial [Tanacetum coccineum]